MRGGQGNGSNRSRTALTLLECVSWIALTTLAGMVVVPLWSRARAGAAVDATLGLLRRVDQGAQSVLRVDRLADRTAVTRERLTEELGSDPLDWRWPPGVDAASLDWHDGVPTIEAAIDGERWRIRADAPDGTAGLREAGRRVPTRKDTAEGGR